MSCTNCFNGCTETTSDRCVKYTGIDIDFLNIHNGDSLLSIEQSIANYLSTVYDGTGIFPTVESICSLLEPYLPETDITLNDLIKAISSVLCDLDTRISAVEADMLVLNDDYDVSCLDGVTDSSDTHDVLQATIDKLCEVKDSLDALIASLPATYATPEYVQEYVAIQLNEADAALYYKKMVPYVAYPFFGTVTGNFGPSGAGIAAWEKVYICNGENGTPDMRGFSLVGATVNSAGGALDPIVATAAYTTPLTYGTLTETLSVNQIPSHTHPATVTVTIPAHTHETKDNFYIFGPDDEWADQGTDFHPVKSDALNRTTDGLQANPEQTLTATATISATGSGESHNNVPPSRACFFIMYLP